MQSEILRTGNGGLNKMFLWGCEGYHWGYMSHGRLCAESEVPWGVQLSPVFFAAKASVVKSTTEVNMEGKRPSLTYSNAAAAKTLYWLLSQRD